MLSRDAYGQLRTLYNIVNNICYSPLRHPAALQRVEITGI